MTETMMNLSNPYDGERRPGSVGFPLPGVTVRIVGEGTGEIYLKGPNVFAGYWRTEATRNAFADGWFKTGDLPTRSPDGYYTLCGRRSDLIISGGFNIYPREIEEFLMEQPEVAEAAVIGEPRHARAAKSPWPTSSPARRPRHGSPPSALLQGASGVLQMPPPL